MSTFLKPASKTLARQRRGVVMIMVLLVLVLLLLSGLGLLSSGALRYAGSRAHEEAIQAQVLARAGLDDARLKLDKRLDFPPPGAVDQDSFTYSEEVLDSSGVSVGHFVVTIDVSRRNEPYYVLRILSRGQVGPRDNPRASRELVAELDVRGDDRRDRDLPDSPTLFRWINWNDRGSI